MPATAPAGRPLVRLTGVLDRLVRRELGVVRFLAEAPRRPELPDFVHAMAIACDTGAFTERRNFSHAGAAAVERRHAVAKAVGEALERYCAAIYDEHAMPLCTAREADFAVVDPTFFALNSEAQYAEPGFPFRRFDADARLRWIDLEDMLSGARVHAPAAFVHLPWYYYEEDGEDPVGQPISNGLACHASPAEARLAALAEVIERDAFTIHWQARMTPCRIARASLGPAIEGLIARFEAVGCRIDLMALQMDHGIPCVLAAQRHEADAMPAVTFAASVALDPGEAAFKALEELAHTLRWMARIKRTRARLDPGPDFAAVVSQETHLNLYAGPEARSHTDFLFAGDEIPLAALDTGATGEPGADLAAMVARVARTGHRPLWRELTTADVAELGLVVGRCLVPGYHPLIMGHRIRALGGARLWRVPQALGHQGIGRASGDNPAPHPFP